MANLQSHGDTDPSLLCSAVLCTSVSVSCSCCNKLLQTPELKTARMYLSNSSGGQDFKASQGYNQAVSRAVVLQDAPRADLFPCLLQLAEAAHTPWLMASRSILQSQQRHPSSAISQVFFCFSLLLLRILAIIGDYLGNSRQPLL